MYVSFFIISLFLPKINLYYIIERVLPAPNRCWLLDNDSSKVSFMISRDILRANHSVLIRNQDIFNLAKDFNCDGYIFIRQNYERITKLLLDPKRMDMDNVVDTKVIFVYGGSDISHKEEVKNFLNRTIFNIIFLRVHDLEKDLLLPDGDMLELHVWAPFLKRKIIFQKEDAQIVNHQNLKVLFKSQKWDPTTRDGIINVCYNNYPPFIVKNEDGVYDGMEYRIFKGVTKNWRANFTSFSAFPHIKNPWISSERAKFLKSGGADLVMHGDCVYSYTSSVDTTSRSYATSFTAILIPKPRPLDPAKYLYLPLSQSSWLCFTASLVATSLVLYFTANFGYKYFYECTPFWQLTYCFLASFQMACGQGSYSPQSFLLRLILVMWLMMTLIVGSTYSSGYSAFMTKQGYTKKLKTMKDVIEAGVYWSENNNSEFNHYIKAMLKYSPFPEWREFANRSTPFPQTYEERKQRIRSLTQGIFVRLLPGNNMCDQAIPDEELFIYMEPLEDIFQRCSMHFQLAPQTPFRFIFDARLSAAIESGLVQHWIVSYMWLVPGSTYDRLDYQEGDLTNPISFRSIRGAFLLLAGGYIMSTICFITELLLRSRIRFNVRSYN